MTHGGEELGTRCLLWFLGPLVVGDVGVCGDKPAAGQSIALDLQNPAIRQRMLHPVGLGFFCQLDVLPNSTVEIARPVVAGLGTKSDLVLEPGSGLPE